MSETEGVAPESSPSVVEPTGLEKRDGKRTKIPKWIKLAGLGTVLICVPLLFILLEPFQKEPAPVMPVSTAPEPFLDKILLGLEQKLKILDKGKEGYPSERQLQAMMPQGIKLLVITGSPDLLVVEISRGDSVWRAMTHERGKPEATTFVTVYKKVQTKAKRK